MKKYVLILFLLVVNYSCKDNEKNVGPTQMQEVMAVHDEMMPKMGTIGNLISKLDLKIKETDSALIFIKARKDLRDANVSMMNWMQGFGDRFDSEEILKGKPLTEEKQRFLVEEDAKVKALREQINISIKNAEAILNKK